MTARGEPQLGKAILQQLASALLPYIEEELSKLNVLKNFYSQKDSPLGRRTHLELVRNGALKGSKLGKLVLVRRDVMHEYIEAHEIEPKTETPESDNEDADPLDDWGLERGQK